MNELNVSRRVPQCILFATIAALVFAFVMLGMSSCDATAVMTPDENAQVAQIQEQIDHKQTDVATERSAAEQAGKDMLEAVKSNDPTAESTALSSFEAARARWIVEMQALQSLVAQQDAILAQAEQRAAAPLTLGAKAAGAPSPLVDLIAAIGLPLIFSQSRKNMLTKLKTELQGNLVDVILAPIKAYAAAYGTGVPSEQVLNHAADAARKEGDHELEMAIRAVKGDPAATTTATTTVSAPLAAAGTPAGS